MRTLLLMLFLTVSFAQKLFAQNQMIVNQTTNSITNYSGNDKYITSVKPLSPIIERNVDSLVKSVFGDFNANVRFWKGVIVDLKKYFTNRYNSDSYNRQWLVPKYELTYLLKDTSIGIKNYPIVIQLDEYGQVLGINWPRTGYSKKSKFVDQNMIKDFALKRAAELNYDVSTYEIDFRYDPQREKFFWIFKFPIKQGIEKYPIDHNCIAVNWANGQEFETYMSRIQMVQ